MILIAEDHADSRDALRALLEAVDYRVCLAANGQEAVESAIAHHPDLILMDIMMPGVDGLEATRTLRATPGFQDIPILALTALEGAKEQVLAAGCNEYIAKPIDVRALLEKVQGWVTDRRSTGA